MMAPTFEYPTSSTIVRRSVSEMISEVVTRIAPIWTSVPKIIEAARASLIEHAMISYDLDYRRGSDITKSEDDRKKCAEMFAIYEAASKLWTLLLKTIRSEPCSIDEDEDEIYKDEVSKGLSRALCFLLNVMGECFHTVIVDPLFYACEPRLRESINACPELREVHERIVRAKIVTRASKAADYLRMRVSRSSDANDAPSPISYDPIRMTARPEDFVFCLRFDEVTKKYQGFDTLVECYRAHAELFVSENECDLPVLPCSRVPVYCFCDSNTARANIHEWVFAALRRSRITALVARRRKLGARPTVSDKKKTHRSTV